MSKMWTLLGVVLLNLLLVTARRPTRPTTTTTEAYETTTMEQEVMVRQRQKLQQHSPMIFGEDTPVAKKPSSSIGFEDHHPAPPKANPSVLEFCGTHYDDGPCHNKSQVLYNSQCYDIFTQGPCAADHWLIDVGGNGTCAKRDCTGDDEGKVRWNGKCEKYVSNALQVNQNSKCPESTIVRIFRDGTTDCDCESGKIYHSTTRKCYQAHTQGPCPNGKIFVLETNKDGYKMPVCQTNPCGADKYCVGQYCPLVKSNSKYCVKMDDKCLCKKNNKSYEGAIRLNYDLNELACIPSEQEAPKRALGNVPPFPCSPGSRRDITGKCRKTTQFSFT